jgi:hypothetical protein
MPQKRALLRHALRRKRVSDITEPQAAVGL